MESEDLFLGSLPILSSDTRARDAEKEGRIVFRVLYNDGVDMEMLRLLLQFRTILMDRSDRSFHFMAL